MSNDRKNFVAYGDAETVVGEIGGKIKNINGQLIGSQLLRGGNPIKSISYPPLPNFPLETMTVYVDPDLYYNRYDYPWLPGYGKNNFKLTISDLQSYNAPGTWNTSSTPITYTMAGITYTLVEDDNGNIVKISAAGTAVGDSEFRLFDGYPKADGTYNLSGCPAGGSTSSYYIVMMNSASEYINDIGEGGEVSLLAESYSRAWITIKSNYAIDGTLDFYPMLSTETSTFEPYSNIGSIEPWDQIVVCYRGKNLCGPWEDGAINILPYKKYNACKSESDTILRQRNLIRLDPTKTYTISIIDTDKEYRVVYFDKGRRLKSTGNWTDSSLTITGEYFITIQVKSKDDDDIYNAYVQVEEGSVATTYADNGDALVVNLDTNLNFYGGSISYENYGLNGNELYSEYLTVKFQDLTWTYDSTYHEFQASLTNAWGSRCTCYKYSDDDYLTNSAPHYRGVKNSKACIIDDNFNGSVSNFLAATGQCKICYRSNNVKRYLNLKDIYGRITIPSFLNSTKTVWTEQNNINFSYQPDGSIAKSERYTQDYIAKKLNNYISYSNNIDNGNINKCPLPLNVTTYTSNGITWTVDHMAGTVTANGTCSGGNSEFVLTSPDGTAHSGYDTDYTIDLNGKWFVKLCPSGGSSNTYCAAYQSTLSEEFLDTGLGDVLQLYRPASFKVTLRICEGQTVNNLVWSPMIILKDVYQADSTIFYPYIPSNKELYALVLQQNTILNNLSGIEVVTD